MSRCYDSIRFAISDKAGSSRFTSFDIVRMPSCRDLVEHIRRYLIGRQVEEVDLEWIRSMASGTCAGCALEAVRLLQETRRLLMPAGGGILSDPDEPAAGNATTSSRTEPPTQGPETKA